MYHDARRTYVFIQFRRLLQDIEQKVRPMKLKECLVSLQSSITGPIDLSTLVAA